MLRSLRFPLFIVFSVLAMLVLGCGKKVDETSVKPPPRYTDPQLSDMDEELNRQELFCGSERSCPAYLAKVAVKHKNQLKFCTGFLTEDHVLVTASSCLPEHLRSRDMPCEKDVFIYFAQSNQKPLRVGCKKVLEASSIQTSHPVLWRSDVAYLELEKDMNRKNILPSRFGMNDKDKFYTWSVDQIDKHQGIIRQADECQVTQNTYFNPLSTSPASPVMSLSGCTFNNGNSGSPVLDHRGRVRGVVSSPLSKFDIDEVSLMRILDRPLRPFYHVSNFACAPLLDDEEVLDEKECNKDLDIGIFDLARREMVDEEALFKASLQRIELNLGEKNRYLQFATKLEASDEGYKVSIYPKCFKNVARWIYEFPGNKPFTFNLEIPVKKIKKSMNQLGQIYASESVLALTPTNFQFRPSFLRANKNATVFMWTNGPATTYLGVKDSCDLLL